jgi:hypothetical protein
VLTFVLGLAVFLFKSRGADPFIPADLIRGLPAVLLGVGALLAGSMFGLRRIYGYAVLLLLSAVLVIVFELDPGWSMLSVGAILLAVGMVLLATFLRNTPVLRAE